MNVHQTDIEPRIEGMGSENEQIQKIFTPIYAPEYLCERILVAIERERIRHGRIRLALSSLSGISSLVGLVFALPNLMRAADMTGFSSYAPLLLSDTDLISTHFSTFMLSLLETLPGIEVSITLFLVAVLLVSVKNIVQSFIQTPVNLFGITSSHA